MTVAGNLAFQSGALYLVQVNPANASSANVTAGGSAALAGTVNAAFAAGSYVSRTYTILSAAGGRNGAFNALTTTNLPAGFTANLSYTASDVILNLTANLGGGPSALGTGGLSSNQRNVANSLNSFFNNGGALPPAFVSVFGLTGGNLGNALSQLSGEAATGGQQAALPARQPVPHPHARSLRRRPQRVRRHARAPRSSFAPERETDAGGCRARLCRGAQGAESAAKAPSFDQRWGMWGAAYGGSNRTSAIRRCSAATISPPAPRALPAASTIASAPTRWWAWRLPAAAPTGAWRRGWAAARATPSRPASTA